MHPDCENCGAKEIVNDLTTIRIGGISHPLCVVCVGTLARNILDSLLRMAGTFKGFGEDKTRELLEAGWGIIANAGAGNWARESDDWQKAAVRWRDDYFAAEKARKS